MKQPTHVIKIDARSIHDFKSFHEVFRAALGFPTTYGHNMDAWIDCMTSLDNPAAAMSRVHAPRGGVLTLLLEHVDDLAERRPEILTALQDAASFVNWRRIEAGEPPVLALAYGQVSQA